MYCYSIDLGLKLVACCVSPLPTGLTGGRSIRDSRSASSGVSKQSRLSAMRPCCNNSGASDLVFTIHFSSRLWMHAYGTVLLRPTGKEGVPVHSLGGPPLGVGHVRRARSRDDGSDRTVRTIPAPGTAGHHGAHRCHGLSGSWLRPFAD